MKIGFYAGSFDPFTNGHLHVIAKSAQLFDETLLQCSDRFSYRIHDWSNPPALAVAA